MCKFSFVREDSQLLVKMSSSHVTLFHFPMLRYSVHSSNDSSIAHKAVKQTQSANANAVGLLGNKT